MLYCLFYVPFYPVFHLEMWPDPSIHMTRSKKGAIPLLWPGYFLIRPIEIFFGPKGKILKNPEVADPLTWPDPSNKKMSQPRSKIFDQDPSPVSFNALNHEKVDAAKMFIVKKCSYNLQSKCDIYLDYSISLVSRILKYYQKQFWFFMKKVLNVM